MAAKEVAVPGESTPPEVLEQADPTPAPDPQPQMSVEDQLRMAMEVIQKQDAVIKAMTTGKDAKAEAEAARASLPTVEQAMKQSRATGKGVLSKDGWVVWTAPPAPVKQPA